MSAVEAPPAGEAAIWHDVECGAYAADLPLWRRLTAPAPHSVLELGSGTGRVALDLAAAGHRVVAVEIEPALAGALEQRAAGSVDVALGDLHALNLASQFDLVIAPMQLLQVLDGAPGRAHCLEVMARHLRPKGIAGAAIVEEVAIGEIDQAQVVPDVRDVGGWVYSSFPK